MCLLGCSSAFAIHRRGHLARDFAGQFGRLRLCNGATLGFNASSPEQAQAWHAAGLAAGGTAVEDPPGIREGKGMKLYLAYLRDPDGNKLCALHWM